MNRNRLSYKAFYCATRILNAIIWGDGDIYSNEILAYKISKTMSLKITAFNVIQMREALLAASSRQFGKGN